MIFVKRESHDIIILRQDKCETHCNNMGGGEDNFNKAHGQQETLQRQAKNAPSQPC